MALAAHTMNDRGTLLLLILQNCFIRQMLHTQLHIWVTFFEKLWHVDLRIAFIKLLIKINCTYAKLKIIEIWSDLHDKVVRPHISQQSYGAALIKFHELFSNTCLVVIWMRNSGFTKY